MSPKITVLMPVYNAATYVGDAVRSILDQTFGDFELLIIDDGSTDETRMTVGNFTDPRVRLIEGGMNAGLARRLNQGVGQSTSPLIARMDADDRSLPQRLQLQVEYLDAHPEIALVGTQICFSRGGRREQRFEVPSLPRHVRWALHFGNCIGHMTVLARRELFAETGGYDETLATAQDYDLWARASDRFLMANLRHALVEVGENPGSISRSMVSTREANARRVMRRTIEKAVGHSLLPPIEEILWSPTSIRRERRLTKYVPEAVSIIEQVTTRSLEDSYATKAEMDAIKKDASYRATRLALLTMTIDLSTGRQLARRSPLISPATLLGASLTAVRKRRRSER